MEKFLPYKLDTSGLYCPEPLMLLHRQIKIMNKGEQVEMIATDPSTWRDVLKFCTFLEHKLLNKKKHGDHFYFLVQKQ